MVHNGILLSYKKKCIWVSSNEVDETGAYYTNEVIQKEKHQYSILTHIYMEFRKMVMITLYMRQQKRHRDI